MFIDPVINPSLALLRSAMFAVMNMRDRALHKNEVYAAHSVIRTGRGSDRVTLQKALFIFIVDPVATVPGSDMDKDHFFLFFYY